ncbi:MAG: DUF1624 domain-containing protein [Bacteroidota bacterium]|nr:DUF1624 domain-containing protein [Bacteroidota bacterium]
MSESKPRYVYIDLLRGWAVLVMIETHVVNAFLLPAVRLAPWFKVLNFINGIVAPSFLFVAGFAFAFIAPRKWSGYLAFNNVFRKQVGRILQVWLVGYALHIPFFSFNKLVKYITPEEMLPFWNVDVLHCIAFSLALLLACVIIGRTQKRFFWIVMLLFLTTVFSAPILWTTNVDGIFPLPVAMYVNALHGSLFPLFPWMGFVLGGSIAGQMLTWAKEKNAERLFFKYVFLGGIAMIFLSLIVEVLPLHFYPLHDFWRASPEFFFIRFGIVMMILATLWYWEKVAHSGRSIASVVGMESLVTYAGHLLVIYGLFFSGHSLSYLIGQTRSLIEVIGMSVLLLAATSIAAYVWNWLKKKSMLQARVFQYALLGIASYVFFTKPY